MARDVTIWLPACRTGTHLRVEAMLSRVRAWLVPANLRRGAFVSGRRKRGIPSAAPQARETSVLQALGSEVWTVARAFSHGPFTQRRSWRSDRPSGVRKEVCARDSGVQLLRSSGHEGPVLRKLLLRLEIFRNPVVGVHVASACSLVGHCVLLPGRRVVMRAAGSLGETQASQSLVQTVTANAARVARGVVLTVCVRGCCEVCARNCAQLLAGSGPGRDSGTPCTKCCYFGCAAGGVQNRTKTAWDSRENQGNWGRFPGFWAKSGIPGDSGRNLAEIRRIRGVGPRIWANSGKSGGFWANLPIPGRIWPQDCVPGGKSGLNSGRIWRIWP